jgi:2-polyprenyl-3-methyl-5-hydroxy-6-metoxy-1,4-benzoquinol methylase
MEPDYAAHENAYQALRRQPGRTGWDEAQVLRRDLALLHAVLRWPQFPPAGDLLEIGCGAGNVSLWFARQGWRVRGVDIAPSAVEWARDNAAQAGLDARFDAGDVLTLEGVADRSVDLVLDGHCLHCIEGPDRARVLSAVRRVLRPVGHLLVRTMCADDVTHLAARADFDAASRCFLRKGVPVRYLGAPESILAELRDAGFAPVRHEVVPAQDADDMDELFALVRVPG